MRASSAILAAGLIALFGACSNLTYVTIPGELHGEGQLAYREVGTFEIELGEHYFLWGFAKTSDEKIARAIVEKVREMGGNGVRDLHYKVYWSFLDCCLSAIGTYVTWNTHTVVVTGTVIQITGGGGGDVTSLEQLEAVAAGSGTLDVPVRDD